MTTMQRIRNESGLSLVKLAALAGVGANTIHKWERGKAKPHRATAQLVADALNVPLYEYLGEPVPLKPCPFCGALSDRIDCGVYVAPSKTISYVECLDCGAEIKDVDAEKAIKAWNRRACNG